VDKQENNRVHWRGGADVERFYLHKNTATHQARKAARRGQSDIGRGGRVVSQENVAPHRVRDRIETMRPFETVAV